jgi:hypothetical protein
MNLHPNLDKFLFYKDDLLVIIIIIAWMLSRCMELPPAFHRNSQKYQLWFKLPFTNSFPLASNRQ